MVSNWANILTIPIPAVRDAPATTRKLFTEFGNVTLAQIKAHVITYSNISGRMSQNSTQLFQCITSSLSVEAKARIIAHREEFTINNQSEGALLLKSLIYMAYVNTRINSSHLRLVLSCLNTYMTSVNSDIIKFNDYMTQQIQGLKARGETTNDLMVNLFKGHLKCSDKAFVSYINK